MTLLQVVIVTPTSSATGYYLLPFDDCRKATLTTEYFYAGSSIAGAAYKALVSGTNTCNTLRRTLSMHIIYTQFSKLGRENMN